MPLEGLSARRHKGEWLIGEVQTADLHSRPPPKSRKLAAPQQAAPEFAQSGAGAPPPLLGAPQPLSARPRHPRGESQVGVAGSGGGVGGAGEVDGGPPLGGGGGW